MKNKDEAEIAVHAPHISQCQPGMPHCLGGQVRGSCDVWQERKARGYPMPWSDGPMVESTFFCRFVGKRWAEIQSNGLDGKRGGVHYVSHHVHRHSWIDDDPRKNRKQGGEHGKIRLFRC